METSKHGIELTVIPLPALMTEQEVAANTGISISMLRQMRRRGDGPAFVKIGAMVRYPATAFIAWVDSLTLCNADTTQIALDGEK